MSFLCQETEQLNLLLMAAMCVIKFTITESRRVGIIVPRRQKQRGMYKKVLKMLGAFGAMSDICHHFQKFRL